MRAETGFGYIDQGATCWAGAAKVRRFVEKPDRKPPVATWKVAVSVELRDVLFHGPTPSTSWRSMPRFCWSRPGSPDASAAVKMTDGIQHELAGEAFAALPDISIDYA